MTDGLASRAVGCLPLAGVLPRSHVRDLTGKKEYIGPVSPLLVLCFTLSGATSLILQVAWARQLTEVFGSSSLAIATVLATFMAGLALGAHLGGRVADRLAARRPLIGYGVAEAAIGVIALGLPLVFEGYRALGPPLWRAMPDQPILLALVRFGLTAVALLLPTTAMGATLPLLGRFVTRQKQDVAAASGRLGALYAANTAGALVGAAAAGFWLIPTIGVVATSRVASVLAIGLGAVVTAVALRRRSGPEAGPDSEPDSDSDSVSDSDHDHDHVLEHVPMRLVLACYAASGAIAMALEVFFSRALGIILGSSVYSFTLVLVVFLAGLSLGAALASRIAARTRRPVALLAGLFLLLALAVLLAHLLLDDLPAIMIVFGHGTTLAVSTLLAIHLLLAGLVILPVALGLGAVLPLVMRCAVVSLDRVGRDVGRAYAANTVGAITGAFAAGFAILPLIGLENGLRLAAAAQAILAALLAWRSTRRRRPLFLAAAALTAAACALSPGWNRSDFTAGLFRGHILTGYMDAGGLRQRDVVFYKDGISTTVSVERANESWVLKNNGKVEASDRHDMPTQILVGLMPGLVHPAPALDVFLIGYGSGVTVGAITQDPRVARIDVAELEPAVLEAADRYFAEVSHHPADDPRVHRHIGDGRNVLIASDRTYDVIISEPSNPWIAGVASLFTVDFYRLAHRYLAPGGVFCQWAQLYELGPARVKMIYRTFHQVFPYVYAFTPGDETTDTILLGSDTPLRFDLAELGARMSLDGALRAELDRAMAPAPEDLIGSLFLGPGEIDAFTAGADINTDDNALLEHTAPRDLLSSVRGNTFARAVRGATWPYGHLDAIVTGDTSGPRAVQLAHALLGYGRRREALAWMDRAPAADVARLRTLYQLSEAVDFRDPEIVLTAGGGGPLPPPAAALFDATPERAQAAVADLSEAYRLMAEARWPAAWLRAQELPRRADSDAGHDVDLFVGYVAYKAITDMVVARRVLRPLYDDPDFVRRRPVTSYYLGRTNYGLGAFRDGIRALERFMDTAPPLVEETLSKRLPGGVILPAGGR
jgi:spermidine synthase